MDVYKIEIEEAIADLSKIKLLIFAAITCEKLLPNYLAFEKTNGWGNHKVLVEAQGTIFQAITKKNLFSKEEIENIIEKVDIETPHTEDFPGIITSFALDACTSLLDTLNFLITNDSEYVVNVAIYARDTVDMFIQEKEDLNSSDPNIDAKIEHDRFMILEKNRQQNLIKLLKKTDVNNITDDLIKQFKNDKPIIDISLLPNL